MPVKQTSVYHISENDKTNHNAHEPVKKDDFKGIVENRHTTDILILIAIIGMWIAMTVVGAKATRTGNPYRLISPSDEHGEICGMDSSVKHESRFYTVSTFGVGVCVESCPSTTANFSSSNVDDYYCLDEVPSNPTVRKLYIQTNCMQSGKFVPGISTCLCNIKAESVSVFHRCVFKDSSFRSNFKNQGTKNYYITAFIQDVMAAKEIIFGFGFGLSIALSFLWVFLMRGQIISHILVWTSLISILVLLIILVILAYTTAKKWDDEDPQEHSHKEIVALQVASVIFAFLGFLYFCLMIFLYDRVELAIKIVAQAASSLAQMPLLAFTPIFNVLGMALFLVPWVFYILFLASDGEMKKNTYTVGSQSVTYTTIDYSDDSIEERLWFMFFCYFWTAEFISAVGSMVISIAVAKWYFTVQAERSNITSGEVITSYGIALRYHLGTAAFGALIIAVVEFIRAIVLYIERKLKQSGTYGQFILTYVFCCINCCLWCIECCMRFISRNAYIQTAIHGTSFCSAAKDAFFLLARNIFRIGALHIVSGMLLFLGRIFVMVATATVSYYFLTGSYGDKLHGFIAPIILIMVIAYFTAAMFMDVFQSSAETLIMCYITDEEVNGTAKFSDASFQNFIKEHGSLADKDLEAHNTALAGKEGAREAQYAGVAKAT